MPVELPIAPPGPCVIDGEIYNAMRRELRRVGSWNVKGGTFKDEPGGFLLDITPNNRTFLTLKITGTVAVGVYTAKSFSGTMSTPGGALAEAQLGTLAAADDCFAWDPDSIGLSTALPLTGLITRGEVVARDTAGTGLPCILIPPPGVRGVRYNGTTKKIQVAYISNPTESDWVDKVTFTTC